MTRVKLKIRTFRWLSCEASKNFVKADKVKLSGGILNSRFWTQLFANIIQHNLLTTRVNELGTLGSAIIAAAASGRYKNLETAINNMVIDKETIQFDKNQEEIYRKKYLIFKKMYKTLEPKFDLLSN